MFLKLSYAIFLSLSAPIRGLPDLVPTGSIASLTCLALNGTVASCCTEDDVSNDGVCAILSCLDGLSIRDGCSCYDIETGCDLLAAYVTDIANARNITDITDITDMCDMVGECCADDGTTITNIDWDFCMAEAAEEANFEMADIVEILLGSIPGLLNLVPTGSTPETGGTPATSSAPAATAAANDAVPTKAPTETPGTGTGVDNPCIICTDGTDVDDFAPYAGNGDFRTCEILIDEAKLYEAGTDYCGWFESSELLCCYTIPEIPCNICPDGATAGDDYVPEYEGNTQTCSDLIESAKQFESGSDACVWYDIDVAFCCPPGETPAPAPMPVDDTTVATTTVSPTLAPEVDNPCIICPNGATAGGDVAPNGATADYDEFQPKTCKELLDGMTNVAVEKGSDLCESMRKIEERCCLDVDYQTRLGGGASVSGLVGFAFISIASTLCVIACM